MVDAAHCDRILEVGCGSGTHSEVIALNYLKKGGLLVSCDFSKDMVTRASQRFQDFKRLYEDYARLVFMATLAYFC